MLQGTRDRTVLRYVLASRQVVKLWIRPRFRRRNRRPCPLANSRSHPQLRIIRLGQFQRPGQG